MPNSYRKKFFAKDGTKFILRELRNPDAKQMMNEINSFVDEPKSGLSINKKMNLRETKVWLKSVLKEIKKKERVLLVVEINKKIVGEGSATREKWKKSHIAMMGIGLMKEARGKGIGTILIKELIKLAKKRMKGLEFIDLSHFDYNKRARHIYQKIGFKNIGRLPKLSKEGKAYSDEIFMRYYLNRNH